MVETGLPKINLPGDEKFVSYKNSLQDYCAKSKLTQPKYLAETEQNGLVGTVSFGPNYVKCNTISVSMKEADALAAFEALSQLGYLNTDHQFVSPRNLKRKEQVSNAMETNAKQVKPETPVVVTAKGHLNQLAQKQKLNVPTYNTVCVNGGFFSTVCVGGASFKSMAVHKKKHDAEQDAANVALDHANLMQKSKAVLSKQSTAAPEQAKKPVGNLKGRLQEYCQKNGIELPVYNLVEGEELQTFRATVVVNGVTYHGLPQPGKKPAAASAAEAALTALCPPLNCVSC